MRFSIILAVLVLLAGQSGTIFAREAELLDFTKRADSAPSRAGYSAASAVAPDNQPGARLATPVAMLPVPSAAMDRQFAWLAQPGIPPEHGYHSGALLPAFAVRPDCERELYTPTWWNPPETERRRAVHFGAVGQIACEFGLPRRLLDALIAQESGFNAFAVSRAGAAGMMQIMPGTARSLGLSNPFDPIANLRAGARYLRQQLDRFGRFDLALAAYNAGPERRSLQQAKLPPIAETRHYVSTILRNWGRLINLEHPSFEAATERGALAMRALHASGYRELELTRFDGT